MDDRAIAFPRGIHIYICIPEKSCCLNSTTFVPDYYNCNYVLCMIQYVTSRDTHTCLIYIVYIYATAKMERYEKKEMQFSKTENRNLI